MNKLTGFLIATALVLGLAFFGVWRYVSLDDLAGCSEGPTAVGGCARADAIVAISGGDTEARTAEAVELYKQGWSERLIVSGAALDPTGPSNAATMRQQAIEAGVPAAAIIVDELSQDTGGNALGVAQIAEKEGIHTIIVVTSPYHQRRAALVFERAFVGLGTVRSHPTANDDFWPTHWWSSPSSWYLVTTEMIKSLAELARGSASGPAS